MRQQETHIPQINNRIDEIIYLHISPLIPTIGLTKSLEKSQTLDSDSKTNIAISEALKEIAIADATINHEGNDREAVAHKIATTSTSFWQRKRASLTLISLASHKDLQTGGTPALEAVMAQDISTLVPDTLRASLNEHLDLKPEITTLDKIGTKLLKKTDLQHLLGNPNLNVQNMARIRLFSYEYLQNYLQHSELGRISFCLSLLPDDEQRKEDFNLVIQLGFKTLNKYADSNYRKINFLLDLAQKVKCTRYEEKFITSELIELHKESLQKKDFSSFVYLSNTFLSSVFFNRSLEQKEIVNFFERLNKLFQKRPFMEKTSDVNTKYLIAYIRDYIIKSLQNPETPEQIRQALATLTLYPEIAISLADVAKQNLALTEINRCLSADYEEELIFELDDFEKFVGKRIKYMRKFQDSRLNQFADNIEEFLLLTGFGEETLAEDHSQDQQTLKSLLLAEKKLEKTPSETSTLVLSMPDNELNDFEPDDSLDAAEYEPHMPTGTKRKEAAAEEEQLQQGERVALQDATNSPQRANKSHKHDDPESSENQSPGFAAQYRTPHPSPSFEQLSNLS